MKRIVFTPSAFSEYNEWIKMQPVIAYKIMELIKDIVKNPFKGIGKPEPLRGNYRGFWSRRINKEHRLIYKVDADVVSIVKCKGHY